MNQNKLYTNVNIRNIFFSVVGIGILANAILLLHILMFVRGHRPRHTDLPIGLLALIHLLSLVTEGFIATDIFMSLRGWDDTTCKSLFYMHRFFRGLSLCVTCLLSVLQAITLSPRSSCLAKFKHISPHHHLWPLLFMCAFYTSITRYLLFSITATYNLTSDKLLYMSKSCSFQRISSSVRHTFFTLLIFREAFLIGLMAISNVYMAALLCRHHKESQHLHSISLSPKASPERRATCTILLLMSFFVVMSTLDSFMSYSRNMFEDDPIFYCIQILVSHSYATVSPLVFLSTKKCRTFQCPFEG